MADFGDIREILQQDPSSHTWTQLSEGLQHWYGTEHLESVIEYCTSHLSHWPEELPTFAPKAWFKRPASTVKKSPITPFFAYCAAGRTTHFVEEARADLAGHKPLKPPKFVDLEALGKLRWRGGEALDEEHRKRFIKMLRDNNDGLNNEKLERLRQLLDDSDCQRWSKMLLEQWQRDGEKSAHKWALFQVAYLGKERDIEFDTSRLISLVSSGGHTRASQYLEIKASFESREAMSSISDFALNAPTRYSARAHAASLIHGAAKQKKAPSDYAYIMRHTSYFDDFYEAIERDKGEALGARLEEAMRRQIAIPAWRLQQRFFSDETRREELAGVVLAVGKNRFHVVHGEPVTLTGKSFELKSSDFVHVVHPAELSGKEREGWKVRFEEDGITPAFAQLAHEVFKRDEPLIPDEGIEVRDINFYWDSSFEEGAEEGNGYTSNVTCAPEGYAWTVSLDLNYFIRVGYGDAEPGSDAPRIEGMTIHSKLGDRVSDDPVVYSEACLMVRDAIDLAAREPED